LIQLWLTAYPEDMDLNYDPATGQRRGKKQEEIKIPLSRLLHQRDCTAILGDSRRGHPLSGTWETWMALDA